MPPKLPGPNVPASTKAPLTEAEKAKGPNVTAKKDLTEDIPSRLPGSNDSAKKDLTEAELHEECLKRFKRRLQKLLAEIQIVNKRNNRIEPTIETRGYFTGPQLEALLLGSSFSRAVDYETKLNQTANKNRGVVGGDASQPQTKDKRPKLTLQQSLKEVFEAEGYGDQVRKERRAEHVDGVFEALIRGTFDKKKDEYGIHYKFIPTAGTGLDFFYGTDALIHTAETNAEIQELIQNEENRCFVSLGVTSNKNKVNKNEFGKNNIYSDIEVYVPSSVEFIGKLMNNTAKQREIAEKIADCVHQSYQAKKDKQREIAELIKEYGKDSKEVKDAKKIEPIWIDVEELLRPSPKSA